jgi:hypothetical protein
MNKVAMPPDSYPALRDLCQQLTAEMGRLREERDALLKVCSYLVTAHDKAIRSRPGQNSERYRCLCWPCHEARAAITLCASRTQEGKS